MPEEYPSEKIWQLLDKMPEELKEVFFSQDTADEVADICGKLKISAEKVSRVAEAVGLVLLGKLPAAEFPETLEREVELKKEIAQSLAQKIDRYIFSPVKESLAGFSPAPGTAPSEKKIPPPKPDVYREALE